MWDTIGQKIRKLRKALGENQAEFGARFGVEQATVSRWEKGEPVQRKFHEPLAKLANLSVSEFFFQATEPHLVPIVGYVSGGEGFAPADEHVPGAEIEHVAISVPDDEQVAVRVRGDSMRPVYRNGDVIIGAKLTSSALDLAIGQDCIVKTRNGDGYVKTVHAGSRRGLYRLRSYNPAHVDVEDVELEWAAPIVQIIRNR